MIQVAISLSQITSVNRAFDGKAIVGLDYCMPTTFVVDCGPDGGDTSFDALLAWLERCEDPPAGWWGGP